jgi:transcriptional regulator with XRE-family HTH domain
MSPMCDRTARRRAVAASVGARIRAARIGTGRSVDDLAATSGVARSSWYAVESGRRSGDVVTRERIATALGVPIAELFAPPVSGVDRTGAAA